MPQNENIQSNPDRLKPTFTDANPASNRAANITTSTKTGDTIGELKTEHK